MTSHYENMERELLAKYPEQYAKDPVMQQVIKDGLAFEKRMAQFDREHKRGMQVLFWLCAALVVLVVLCQLCGRFSA